MCVICVLHVGNLLTQEGASFLSIKNALATIRSKFFKRAAAKQIPDLVVLHLTFVGTGDDLATYRLTLGIIAFEKFSVRFAVQHEREFPGQIESVLDTSIRAQAVCRRMTVDGIPDAEYASFRIA